MLRPRPRSAGSSGAPSVLRAPVPVGLLGALSGSGGGAGEKRGGAARPRGGACDGSYGAPAGAQAAFEAASLELRERLRAVGECRRLLSVGGRRGPRAASARGEGDDGQVRVLGICVHDAAAARPVTEARNGCLPHPHLPTRRGTCARTCGARTRRSASSRSWLRRCALPAWAPPYWRMHACLRVYRNGRMRGLITACAQAAADAWADAAGGGVAVPARRGALLRVMRSLSALAASCAVKGEIALKVRGGGWRVPVYVCVASVCMCVCACVCVCGLCVCVRARACV